MKTAIKINSQYHGWSIRRFLRTNFSYLSQDVIHKNIRTGDIRINQKKIKIDDCIQVGDILNIWDKLLEPKNTKEIPDRGQYSFLSDLLLESNRSFFCFNKPAGLAVQGGTGLKTNLNYLANGLMKEYDDKFQSHIVHRLDRATSGVCLLATNHFDANLLGNLFSHRLVQKHYVAICQNIGNGIELEDNQEGVLEDLIDDRKSVTKYLVKKVDDDLALVYFFPVTGRKHQIRIHANRYLWPILGDKVYNEVEVNSEKGNKYMFLHAKNIIFELYDQKFDIVASLPNHFSSFTQFFPNNGDLK